MHNRTEWDFDRIVLKKFVFMTLTTLIVVRSGELSLSINFFVSESEYSNTTLPVFKNKRTPEK